MESVGDDANSVFHEDQKFFKSVTFEIFGKCSESVNFDVNNDFQEDLKIHDRKKKCNHAATKANTT